MRAIDRITKVINTEVEVNGFKGIIVKHYDTGMFEVRLKSGIVVVDIDDIKIVNN